MMRSLFVVCFFTCLIFVFADEGCKQPFSVSAAHAPIPSPIFTIGMDSHSSSGSGGGGGSTAEKSCGPFNNVTPRRTSPSFAATAVVDEKFTKVDLDDYFGKWVVLLFYPYDFTFVCPTEILAFSEKNDEFLAINTHVFAISTDSHHTHLAWVRTPRENGGLGKVNIPLVADTSKAISRSFGVLVDDPTDDMYGAALRGLFLIDPLGKVRSMQINDDQVGRSVNETLRLIKAFQYADQHGGEVCPANWKPGDDTIIADPDKSKQYFKRVHGQSQKLDL